MIEQLSDLGETIFETATIHAGSIRSSAEQLLRLRSLAADTPCERLQEQAKRDMLALWSHTAATLMQAADLIERGAIPDDELRKELYDMLVIRCSPEVADERSRNISQAYQGRIVREPK